MKIALSTRSFQLPLIGGVDVYTDRLGRAVERRGEEVFYLAFNSSEEYGSDIQVHHEPHNGRQIWRSQFDFNKRPPEAFQLGYDREMGEQIRSILDREKPDLFIILNFYMSTLASVEAAKSIGIPIVHIATDFLPVCRRATMIRWDGISCEVGESIKSCSECFVSTQPAGRLAASVLNLVPEDTLVNLARKAGSGGLYAPLKTLNPYWKQVGLMERRLAILSRLRREIDLVLAPNQNIARLFRENGFTTDQVKFLPFGVEPENPLAAVQHSESDHTRFLFIGRLQPYKGAHLLVRAFNQLVAPKNATLTIYGVWDGQSAYKDELEALMAANENVQFNGKIPPAELGRAFAEADYFVLPSTWHENSPLILLDALQSHTPVISSEIRGVTDVVKDSVNGLLFPMGDVAALQATLQRAIDQPELADKLRARSTLPDIDSYVDAMFSFCRELQILPERANIH